MKADWKSIKDYPKDKAPVVLARYRINGGSGPLELPMLVRWVPDYPSPINGHFYICPGVPMFYGKQQFGMMICDHVEEFTELPE